MKRLMIVCAVAFSVSGCAGVQTAFDIATTPVEVTQTTVSKVESGLKVATAGLVAYRRLCVKKAIDPVTRNCRGVIEAIQPYTKAAKIAIADLRQAVRENNQVNALTAYRSLQSLITNIQNERLKAGGI